MFSQKDVFLRTQQKKFQKKFELIKGDVVDTATEGSDAVEELDQLPMPPVAGEVTFQNVDFKFNTGSPLGVKNVSPPACPLGIIEIF